MITKHSPVEWYTGLNKPSFTPPNWLFGPVWAVLYVIIGTALGHMNKVSSSFNDVMKQNICFVMQLLLNGGWSYIYFGAHQILYAWMDLLLLWFVIIMTIYYFLKVSRAAGALLVPYFIWVTYANVLNGAIWYLNK